MRGEDAASDLVATPGEAAERTPPWTHVVAIAAICLAGTLAHAPGLDGAFVLDDAGNILENPHIRTTELSAPALWEAAFESRDPTRPVANASLALNYWWGGSEVRGYHVFNIVVHLATSVAVYALAWLLLGDARRDGDPDGLASQGTRTAVAATTALLFAVHPIQTQAVVYVIQRMTSLATLFTLVALLAWRIGRGLRGGRRTAWWALALLAWGLGLASKPIAITLPVLIGLYEWFFLQDLSRDWIRRQRGWLAAAGVVLVASGVTVLATTGILEGYERRDFTLGERLLTQPRVIARYVGLIAFPHPSRLSLDHTVDPSRSVLDPITTALSLAALAGALAGALGLARRARIASFCILWFLVNLVLESSLVPLEMMFEHRLYLPLVGPCLLASLGLFHLVPGQRAFTAVAVAAVLVTLTGYSRERSSQWASPVGLWSDAVAKSPDSHRAHYNLGVHLLADGDPRAAAGHFARSAELRPGFARAHTNLGVSLGQLGELEVARRHLEQAIALDPTLAEAHHSLGTALRLEGDLAAAIEHYREAARLAPDEARFARALADAEREAASQ